MHKHRFGVLALAVAASAGVLAGCGSSTSSDGANASVTESAPAGSVTEACQQVTGILDAVTQDPTADEAAQLRDRLLAVTANAPTDVQRATATLAEALVAAANVPDGFAPGAPTESKFVLAAQELTIICEPEGPDPAPTRPQPTDPESATDLAPQ